MTAKEASMIRENCNNAIELENCLTRLEINSDFKRLVKEYTEKEPVRIAGLFGEGSINMDKNKAQYREDLQEALIGIGRFSSFLRVVHQLGERAKDDLDKLSNTEIEG